MFQSQLSQGELLEQLKQDHLGQQLQIDQLGKERVPTTNVRRRRLKASITVTDPRKIESRISSAEEKKSAIKTPDKIPDAIAEAQREQTFSAKSGRLTENPTVEGEPAWIEKYRDLEELLAMQTERLSQLEIDAEQHRNITKEVDEDAWHDKFEQAEYIRELEQRLEDLERMLGKKKRKRRGRTVRQ